MTVLVFPTASLQVQFGKAINLSQEDKLKNRSQATQSRFAHDFLCTTLARLLFISVKTRKTKNEVNRLRLISHKKMLHSIFKVKCYPATNDTICGVIHTHIFGILFVELSIFVEELSDTYPLPGQEILSML
jgi:hypothetical protein